MPIRSTAVGTETPPYDQDITTRRCLAYAAALGETDDVYFDDARPGGIIAHPAMAVSLEWPPSRDLRLVPAFGATPDEHLRVVHAEQDTQFHTPIRPGDKLSARGHLISVERIKPGAKTVTKLILERDDGTPISTSFSTAIYRGVETDGADTVTEAPAPWPEEAPPNPWAETSIAVARELPHIYTECADIFSGIHTEREVALAAGLPDIILHGTCTWALAMSVIIDAYLDGQPEKLARFAGRFTGMVIPGTDIIVRHGATPSGAQFEVIAADGSTAISKGSAAFEN